ncbi:unnamed protein product [Ascophyllum nodosum]
MLVERAVKILNHFWGETGGDLYSRWLDRFEAKQGLGDDVIDRMGWSRFLLKMMREEPQDAVVVRTAKKDSDEVIEARNKNSARPPTLSPWRHTVNQLSADWDAEEEEEMKVALDHPPQLKSVSTSVVVQPVDIAKKIMNVREMLAAEWREDLANMETENEEIARVDADKMRLGEEEAERARRLTYDHGEAFGGDSSPFRAENYEALVDFVTEIGAIAVQERMRQIGDDMGWNWMEQFLYWAKANSRSGSAGAEAAGTPPMSPAASQGGIGEDRGAMGKAVQATFGSAGGGVYEADEEKKMRGNRLLEAMIMGQKVQMLNPETGELMGVDPAEVCKSVMAARVGVAERIRVSLDAVSEDHGLVMRKYLQEKWHS